MPAFHDPHSSISTPTYNQSVTEYEAIREKSAIQKREVEKNLIKSLMKAGSSESLFLNQENDCFSLIGNKPPQPAYLSALLPNDQVFDVDSDGENDVPATGKEIKINEKADEINHVKEEVHNSNELDRKQVELIDNPFLRPVKHPKFP